MQQTISRSELYDLVWSKPIKVLAPTFGVSDVGLKKACIRGHIPVPDRGYWAKIKAGKPVYKAPLPARGPGMSDEVTVGASRSYYYQYSEDELLKPLPPEPAFPEPIDDIRNRYRQKIGRVAVPRTLKAPVRAIRSLLEQDEKRRLKQLESPYLASWYKVRFDTPPEKRRLRIADAILMALAKQGFNSSTGENDETFYVKVGSQTIALKLYFVQVKSKKAMEGEHGPEPRKLQASIKGAATWDDSADTPIEEVVGEIATEVIAQGEEAYRSSCRRTCAWRQQRKAEIEQARIKAAEEARRKETERQRQLEQERIDRLLSQAEALRRANAIRSYVDAVCSSEASHAEAAGIENWRRWALDQADRLDPTSNGSWREDIAGAVRIE